MNQTASAAAKHRSLLVLAGVVGWFFLGFTAPAQTVLIPTNAVWKYFDRGWDLGPTRWRDLLFDDSSWAQGPAELGYGSTPEGHPVATPVSYGPSATNKYITTYFRRTFVVTNLTAVS